MTGDLADRVQSLTAEERCFALGWLLTGPDTTELESALRAVERHRAVLLAVADGLGAAEGGDR